MIPPFKFYFYPFLSILNEKGCCRLYDLNRYIAKELNLTNTEKMELTKGGRVTKHSSRVNYCSSYLKKMELIESFSSGVYNITKRGKQILEEFGSELTLTDLRNLPEFIATQICANNTDVVYVKPHIRGGRKINAYICNKKLLKEKNPNIEFEVIDSFRKKLKDSKESL